MKLIANGLNGSYLREILDSSRGQVEWIKAAVAYASGTPELLEFCRINSIPLEFWGRMDCGLSVGTSVLEKFLNSGPGFKCKLVWEFYHPKIIWFGEYGVYIGSANLTERAWYKNIECGVFISQEQLETEGLISELNDLFEGIDERSAPLTRELFNKIKDVEDTFYNKYSDLSIQQKDLEKAFENKIGSFISPKFEGLTVVSKKSANEKKRLKFLAEWNDTLEILRQISEQVSSDKYRPKWISKDVPKGVQVDQFLHAYFYSFIKTGNSSKHEEFYEKNRTRPQAALEDAMSWWRELGKPVEDEDKAIYEKAPYLKDILTERGLLNINEAEFLKICQSIFAFWHSSRQTKNQTLGLESNTSFNQPKRLEVVSKWIWTQKSGNHSNVVDVIRFVLYKGSPDDICERLWQATFTDEWHIPQFGLSCMGEIIGWAMPDRYPPRNGRTSKALKALGHNVKIYS
ncbi:phospholipase D family protein [Bdellovibrio sp. NC01]|uniref:phospholipase D family protein n=1 Tax=Bdellovibrio sp. NC01 TaxID=2220073 RepID=UPI00115B4373|nr:phospholipase D family protein [Bdellovibrio sp. NC01]QDK37193.1 hypothetical protein DOE51_06120 [Bdellovibrio sp. NC01]